MSTEPSSPSGPDYLEPGPAPSRKGPRAVVLGLAAVAAAGAVGVGGWAAVTLMSSGSQPTEAIPANALTYVSVDLDPSAAQKVEAFKILKKFPALDDELEVSSQDDLRRWVFEKVQEEGTCTGLDYEKDVAPWIGDRVAMAMVPAESKGDAPTPLVALQVSDEEAAAEGIAAIAECGDAGEDFGFAFTGGYALLSDSTEHAESLAGDAGEGSLADDDDYQAWMDRLGEPGILTMYVAPNGMDAMLDLQQGLADDLPPMGGVDPRAQAEVERLNEEFRELYTGFSGMAGVVRFDDGAVEAEVAADQTPESFGMAFSTDDLVDVAGLPSGTAAVFGTALPEGWGSAYLDLFGRLVGDPRAVDQVLRMAEAQTGLQIPEDVERMLGDAVTITLDGSMDVEAASYDPSAVPAGVRVSGDPAEIRAAVEKARRALGPDGEALVVEEGDGSVAVGLNADYVRRLVAEGGLGDDATFSDVVPEATRVASVIYLDLDAVTAWIDQAVAQAGGPMGPDDKVVRDNLEPLRAVGFSTWVEEDGSTRMLLRVATD